MAKRYMAICPYCNKPVTIDTGFWAMTKLNYHIRLEHKKSQLLLPLYHGRGMG